MEDHTAMKRGAQTATRKTKQQETRQVQKQPHNRKE